jgi:hypothetical protein
MNINLNLVVFEKMLWIWIWSHVATKHTLNNVTLIDPFKLTKNNNIVMYLMGHHTHWSHFN